MFVYLPDASKPRASSNTCLSLQQNWPSLVPEDPMNVHLSRT